ncbi:VIP peptides-like [Rhinolophus ferrumequinum]|uniref:VIP peptides-like n=1 Tax=Rhinolophus ferrumequinum TaxID=59479 RepID=UPI00140FA6B8|nr:VIP peptides-like [Rhinolophus ferrumequinum]
MESRRKPQLLVHLTLFSVLFSQTLAWPLFETPFLNDRIPFEGANELDPALLTPDTDILPNAFAGNDRNARHAEEIITSEYKRLLGQLPAKRHVESFIGKRDSDDITEISGTAIPPLNEQIIDKETLKYLLQYLGIRILEEK